MASCQMAVVSATCFCLTTSSSIPPVCQVNRSGLTFVRNDALMKAWYWAESV